jgi:hypothetical protein
MPLDSPFNPRVFFGNRCGSLSVEFAFVAPVLLLAVFGAVEIGRGLYEQSRFSAATAIATRVVSLDPTSSETDVKNAIASKLKNYELENLNIMIADHSYSGQQFKEIQISYHFDFLISLGNGFDGMHLNATSYAPMIASK